MISPTDLTFGKIRIDNILKTEQKKFFNILVLILILNLVPTNWQHKYEVNGIGATSGDRDLGAFSLSDLKC